MTRGLGGVRRRGRIWWIHYQVGGKTRFESSGSTERKEAINLLRERNLRPHRGSLRFEDLRAILLADYRLNERKSLVTVTAHLKQLEKSFHGDLASDITSGRLSLYASARKQAGARPATIRNELGVLRRAFNLAAKGDLVATVPHFPAIHIDNARAGFWEEGDFERVAAYLPAHLQPVVRWAFWTGWRKSEILGLEWSQVDLQAGTVRLDRTKNKRGRLLPYRELPELVAIIEGQRASRDELQAGGRICPWVFHCDGQQVSRWYYRAWKRACREAGVPGRLFHDFRRTAARRLVRSGVNEKVAMELMGHRTRSIFDRYNIASDADLAEGLAKVRAKRGPEQKGGGA